VIEFHSPSLTPVDLENFGTLLGVDGLEYMGTVGALHWAHEFKYTSSSSSESNTTNTKKRNLLWSDVLQTLEGLKTEQTSLKRSEVPAIKWYEEQIPKRREKREGMAIHITDPLYPEQWHLHGVNKYTHLNVEAAWELGVRGERVRIAIVDDGIQTTHPDLADNVRVDSSWNFNGNKQSPDPTYKKGPSGVRFSTDILSNYVKGLARNSVCWRCGST